METYLRYLSHNLIMRYYTCNSNSNTVQRDHNQSKWKSKREKNAPVTNSIFGVFLFHLIPFPELGKIAIVIDKINETKWFLLSIRY